MRRNALLALLCLFTLLAVPGETMPRPVRAQQPQTTWDGEIRGFWVDAWNGGFKTPAQVSQLIADAHTANANTLFVQVRRRGDSYYSESAEPRVADTALDPAPYDPLATIITAAHNANPPLKVYAWVVVFPVWGDINYSTTDPARHVYYRHGKDRTWDDPENWLTYHIDSNGNLYQDVQLDPGHPGAARYTVNVCLYLLRHYDVDGLTLDYIRYDGQNYGYNKVNEDRFHAVYGGIGHPLIGDANWSQWRRDQVTNVVRRLYVEAHAVKPDVVISAATIAWGAGPQTEPGGWSDTNAYWDVFQDWRNWLDEGIIDLALPMNYNREHNQDQALWFDQWIEWEKGHQFNRAIAVAQGSWMNYIAGTLTQIQEVQAPSSSGNYMAGASIYSYANTNAGGVPNSTFYAALAQPSSYGTPPWSTWVDVPTFSWKTSPTLGHLMGWAIGSGGPQDGATVTISGPESRTLYADANGFFSAVDLLPGDYTISGAGSTTLYATVTAGRTAIATVAPPAADPELRAVLVDAGHDGFKTADQVDVLLADVRAANLNTVIVQVRDNAQLYYSSTLEPRTDDPEVPAGFDPLGYLLQQAHGGSPAVEVYAWLPMYPVWDGDTPPSNPAHLFNQHPDWLTQDVNGGQRSNGIYHLDPGHPSTHQYLRDLVADLLDHYSVDGLFLDNLYYPPENSTIGYPVWGYNAVAVQRFHAAFGGYGNPDPADANWMLWRRNQPSDLLRRIYIEAAGHSHVRVAVSAIDWGDSPDYAGGWEQSSAYGRVLQDWQAWLEEGILDLAAPQNYDREYDASQAPWYDHWLAWEDGQRANRGVLVLQGSYLNYPEDTLTQAAEVPGNAVGFSNYIPSNLYADPDGNSRSVQPPRQPWYYTPQAEWWLWRGLAAPYGYVDPVNGGFYRTSPLFPSTVSTPVFPWKDTPTMGHAYGWAIGNMGLPMDGTSVILQGEGVYRNLHSDALGFFAAIDLPPGDYFADVIGASPPNTILVGRVTAGQATQLYPCENMDSVTVVGPPRLAVGQTGYFGTEIQPPEAAVVLQYDWSNGSTGSTAAYSWPNVGTYTVSVTVTNVCSEGQGAGQVEVIAEWTEQVYLPVIFK